MDAKLTRRAAMQWTGAAFAWPIAPSQALQMENEWMPFTPKFVDLVRNVATVSGTGPVTVGPAVSGFASLAGAIGSGEQFYYCLQGVDKPQEREVGRGTMLPDGRVARETIAGALMSFTSGAKTIALVAPAEWFARVEQLGSDAVISTSTRSELAAKRSGRVYLAEGPRAGSFEFDPSDLSAMVAADPRQGIYVAAASDPSGASGAWVRRFHGEIYPEWFGAVGDGVTDDYPAFAAAVACLTMMGGGTIRAKSRTYRLNSTLSWDAAPIALVGEGKNTDGGTVLHFPNSATQIGCINPKNGPAALGGGSSVRQLVIKGGNGAAVSEANARLGYGSGLLSQCGGYFESVTALQCEGNGIYVLSSVTDPIVAINANGGTYVDCWGFLCKNNGRATLGADTNQNKFIGGGGLACNLFGDYENGFLGNHYFAPLYEGNLVGPIRFGNHARQCRVSGAYKESGTALIAQFDAGGGGNNVVDFALLEGDANGTTTIIDNSGANNDVTVFGVRRTARFGGDGANGTVNIDGAGDLVIRGGGKVRFQDNPLTANWFGYVLGGNLVFESGGGAYLSVRNTGINVVGAVEATGSIKVGGNQVVGARGAALPADATDLASAITLVNAIKARLKATGGHGLVAD